MNSPPNFAKESSSPFHRELDLSKLRAFHETLYNPAGEVFACSSADEKAKMSELVAENVAAIDAIIARGEEPPAGAIPCDVFNYMEGEAPDRAMTKLGGLPYWPADRHWPTNWRGKPLSFLGQINFRDSRDIVGAIPGEILVMFIDRFDRVKTYWMNPTNEPLIASANIPKYERYSQLSYGVIHRTYDVSGRTLSEDVGARAGVESFIFDLKIAGIPWGHDIYRPAKGRFLIQLTPPGEVFEDGTIGCSGMVVTRHRGRWSFLSHECAEPEEYELNWWAAHIKSNGKLRWSWA